MQLSGGQGITLLTAFVLNRDVGFADAIAAANHSLDAAGADPNGWLSRARTASNTAWRDYFARSSVRLPQSPLTERFFYAALYLLRLSAGGDAPPVPVTIINGAIIDQPTS